VAATTMSNQQQTKKKHERKKKAITIAKGNGRLLTESKQVFRSSESPEQIKMYLQTAVSTHREKRKGQQQKKEKRGW
jgi:hypothetical protein